MSNFFPRVGSAVLARDSKGRILIVRRAKEPHVGKWVLPGGGIKPFESIAAAAVRELYEETGAKVLITGTIDVYEIIEHGSEHRIIIFSWGQILDASGLQPGGDVSEVRLVPVSELAELDLTPLTRHVFWDVQTVMLEAG